MCLETSLLNSIVTRVESIDLAMRESSSRKNGADDENCLTHPALSRRSRLEIGHHACAPPSTERNERSREDCEFCAARRGSAYIAPSALEGIGAATRGGALRAGPWLIL